MLWSLRESQNDWSSTKWDHQENSAWTTAAQPKGWRKQDTPNFKNIVLLWSRPFSTPWRPPPTMMHKLPIDVEAGMAVLLAIAWRLLEVFCCSPCFAAPCLPCPCSYQASPQAPMCPPVSVPDNSSSCTRHWAWSKSRKTIRYPPPQC